MGPWRF